MSLRCRSEQTLAVMMSSPRLPRRKARHRNPPRKFSQSLHGKEEVDLNDSNFGFGVEYQFTETQSLTAGTFKNSDFEQSRYLGWYWLPLALGPVRFGGTFGIMDGYSKARNGKFFPAVLPAISYKRSRLGVNIYPIPGFSDNLYTAISIQVKIRID